MPDDNVNFCQGYSYACVVILRNIESAYFKIGKKELKQETQHKTYTHLSNKAHSYTYKHFSLLYDYRLSV